MPSGSRGAVSTTSGSAARAAVRDRAHRPRRPAELVPRPQPDRRAVDRPAQPGRPPPSGPAGSPVTVRSRPRSGTTSQSRPYHGAALADLGAGRAAALLSFRRRTAGHDVARLAGQHVVQPRARLRLDVRRVVQRSLALAPARDTCACACACSARSRSISRAAARSSRDGVGQAQHRRTRQPEHRRPAGQRGRPRLRRRRPERVRSGHWARRQPDASSCAAAGAERPRAPGPLRAGPPGRPAARRDIRPAVSPGSAGRRRAPA